MYPHNQYTWLVFFEIDLEFELHVYCNVLNQIYVRLFLQL